jgi:hypothetical protein
MLGLDLGISEQVLFGHGIFGSAVHSHPRLMARNAVKFFIFTFHIECKIF